MSIVHETIVKPRQGQEQEVASLLLAMGGFLAAQPGFIEGYTLDGLAEGGLLARVTVWQSRDDAERSAALLETMALRAKLQTLVQSNTQELLLDIVSERHADVREPVTA
ncbi:MAG: hypothetical protein EXR49_04185 [Dehalococcoidia bacterium]|nr:hypothetical protein [Dehalococcoidia bacterium]